MTLILVVPGLLWPRQIMRDTLYDAEFPALQTLLGKGRRLPTTCATVDDWWCSRFGITTREFSPAALRLLALGGDAGDSIWLCADPVNLHVGTGGATINDPATLNITADEAAQLHETLTPMLAESGELVVTTPSQWHLRLTVAPPNFPNRLHELIGESATSLLPAGNDGRPWRQLINDIQIALHQHPVNLARTEKGLSAINSLAFWGAGRIPAISTSIEATVQCDDLVIAGLTKCGQVEVSPLATKFSASRKGSIVHWDKLLRARGDHDAMRWREGLQQLENDWLAPALAALTNGSLKRIELHGFGDEAPISIAATPRHRYHFWRKPSRLEAE